MYNSRARSDACKTFCRTMYFQLPDQDSLLVMQVDGSLLAYSSANFPTVRVSRLGNHEIAFCKLFFIHYSV